MKFANGRQKRNQLMWVVIHEQKKIILTKQMKCFINPLDFFFFFFTYPSWKEPIEDFCKGEAPSITKLEGDWMNVFFCHIQGGQIRFCYCHLSE